MNAYSDWFPGRTFEVYSVVSKEPLSKPITFNAAFAEMDRMGASSAMDIREIK